MMFLKWGEVEFACKNFSINQRVFRKWIMDSIAGGGGDALFGVGVDFGLEIVQLME